MSSRTGVNVGMLGLELTSDVLVDWRRIDPVR